MKDLRVSKDVALPLQVVTHRNALLAMSGAGKSNACVVVAEEMHRAGVPWCALDPKGDWWGIRSSADGKGAGLDVPILGGDHADLPLSPHAGARMAELVATGRLTGVFDLSDFAHERQTLARFMADFGAALLQHQRTPMHLFLDEADEYLPQPGAGGKLEGHVAACVSAWKRVATKGRQKGIGYTLISQRSANVNKSALYMCETLIAMRTMGKRDRDAIRDFVEAHGQADELVKSLPSLEDGEAWIWSPVRLRMMQRTRFRRRETFDSGRTPELGEALVVPRLADIDIGALRAELAALDQAEEPKPDSRPNGYPQQMAELRGRIAELERELAAKPGFDEARAAEMHAEVAQTIQRALQTHGELLGAVNRLISSYREHPVGHRDVKPETTNGKPVDDLLPGETIVAHAPDLGRGLTSNGRFVELPRKSEASGLSKCARSLLVAIYQHGTHGSLTLTQAAIIAGYASDSGGVRNAAGELRAGGFVNGSNAAMQITDRGAAEVSDAPKLPTGKKLAEHWYSKLDRAERLILSEVVAAFPGKRSLTDAAKRAGYAPDSGGVRNAAGKLRTLALVHGSNAGMTADKRLV